MCTYRKQGRFCRMWQLASRLSRIVYRLIPYLKNTILHFFCLGHYWHFWGIFVSQPCSLFIRSGIFVSVGLFIQSTIRNNMDLQTLVKKAKEKDTQALGILYRMYYPKMLGLCVRLIK